MDPFEKAKETVKEVLPKDLKTDDNDLVILDVREEGERQTSYIENSLHVPRAYLEMRLQKIPKDKRVITYCASGKRSLLAAQTLQELGYNAQSLDGGIQAWVEEGLPLIKPRKWSQEEKERYSRHLILDKVGIEGQEKLINSRVLVVGAGGLGSPLLLYLAAAGVGTLGIVDFDYVEKSNLQRQIIHETSSENVLKSSSAKDKIEKLNPLVKVNTYEDKLDSSNVLEILDNYDLVVDGTDNFPTRYLLSDAAVYLKKPLVTAAVLEFEGQLAVFKNEEPPCYRCLFPAPPPAELAPACGDVGILGSVAGVLGTMQSTEVLKLILGLPVLENKLMTVDTLSNSTNVLQVAKRANCPACSQKQDKENLGRLDEEYCVV